jgi:hypothetical protein
MFNLSFIQNPPNLYGYPQFYYLNSYPQQIQIYNVTPIPAET